MSLGSSDRSALQMFSLARTVILPRHLASAAPMSTGMGHVAQIIHTKITSTLTPSVLEIYNDSAKHAHHTAMKDQVNKTETHFRLLIVSDKFSGLPLLKRHRMVNELLADELKSHIHALQLITKSPQELAHQGSQ